MSAEKDVALVLRVIDFSETSCVVTLFTRELGKIHGLAKGGRRPKGPFEAALDLLARCRVVFLRKSSDALDLLTEAKLERRFRGRDRDLSSLYAGYYVAELLNELTDDYDSHPALFDAADQTLVALSGDQPVAALVLRFELTLLRLLGHLPSLANCVECGRPIELTGRIAFGLHSGGVLCTTCRPGKRNVVSTSAAVIRTLDRFADPDDQRWQSGTWDRDIAGELRGLLNHYLYQLLGRKPRMHGYLGFLAN